MSSDARDAKARDAEAGAGGGAERDASDLTLTEKEQAEEVTRDMRMCKVSTTKNKKNAVKYEQVEGLAGAMKMTQDITFKHDKHAEYMDDLEVKNEFGEYFEDYKEIGEQLKKEQSQIATKEVT